MTCVCKKALARLDGAEIVALIALVQSYGELRGIVHSAEAETFELAECRSTFLEVRDSFSQRQTLNRLNSDGDQKHRLLSVQDKNCDCSLLVWILAGLLEFYSSEDLRMLRKPTFWHQIDDVLEDQIGRPLQKLNQPSLKSERLMISSLIDDMARIFQVVKRDIAQQRRWLAVIQIASKGSSDAKKREYEWLASLTPEKRSEGLSARILVNALNISPATATRRLRALEKAGVLVKGQGRGRSTRYFATD